MPPTQEMIQRAAAYLAEVELQSFTATPGTIEPLGAASAPAWRARPPASCLGLGFRLNSTSVPASGTVEWVDRRLWKGVSIG
jgi:hypothetical protein